MASHIWAVSALSVAFTIERYLDVCRCPFVLNFQPVCSSRVDTTSYIETIATLRRGCNRKALKDNSAVISSTHPCLARPPRQPMTKNSEDPSPPWVRQHGNHSSTSSLRASCIVCVRCRWSSCGVPLRPSCLSKSSASSLSNFGLSSLGVIRVHCLTLAAG